MRPIKQSNSMKELLKKLKRHDTLVLASGVVVATLLCGAFVYVTTPAISADAAKQEVQKDSLGVQKKASSQLNEIQNYLEKLDEVVTSSQSLVKDIQTVQNEQKELVEKTISEEKTLSKEKNSNTVNNNSKVVEKISGLDKELQSIHSEISSTNEQVKELQESMKKGGNSDPNKDKESFAQITNALGDLKKTCDQSGADISGIIDTLKNDKGNKSESQKEVINNLETIVKSLEKVDTKENLTKLETDLKSTQSTYVHMLDETNKNITKTADNVKKVKDSVSKVNESVQNVEDGVNKVSSSVSNVEKGVNKACEDARNTLNSMGEVRKSQENSENQLVTMNNNINSINSEISELKNSIEKLGQNQETPKDYTDKLDKIESQVEAVFQSSGSSFDRLASMLSDYVGYKAPEDATFNDLIDVVAMIPTSVINSKNIQYEYHHHTDGTNEIAGETCSHSGGCFGTPVYHVHSSACVKYTTSYKYWPKIMKLPGSVNVKLPFYAVCKTCNMAILEKDYEKHTHITTSFEEASNSGGRYESIQSGPINICNKTEKTVEYYLPVCGFKNGDKVRAIVEFPKRFTDPSMLTASMVSAPGESGINDALFDFENEPSYENGEANDESREEAGEDGSSDAEEGNDEDQHQEASPEENTTIPDSESGSDKKNSQDDNCEETGREDQNSQDSTLEASDDGGVKENSEGIVIEDENEKAVSDGDSQGNSEG